MTTGTQNYQVSQPQYQYGQPYTYNPYLCTYAPVSQVVIPQGQVQMPNTIVQPPQLQVIQQPPQQQQSVNYNQVTPYLNTNSNVLQPSVTTKSGQAIAVATVNSSQPYNQQNAQVIYQGPVKTINPQITPVEQTDNEIEKQYRQFFKDKAEYNSELKKALNKTIGGFDEEKPWYKKPLCIIGAIAIAALFYKFRAKIPFVKKFCK